MIDIFEPLDIPSGFLVYRAQRLERQAGLFGVRIKARWLDRVRLVTSDIRQLTEPLPLPVVEDLDGLTLLMGPPSESLRYLPTLGNFAARAKAAVRVGNRTYERVPGAFGRVHLVLPYESKAACGVQGISEAGSTFSLSCRSCLSLVRKYQIGAADPLVAVTLRADELLLAKKVAPNPKFSAVPLPGSDVEQDHFQ